MAFGIKLSKSGDDVKTAAAKNLLLTIDHNTLKLHTSRKDTIASGGTLNIAHGFAYKPVFMVFMENWQPASPYVGVDTIVDGTNVSIRNNSGATKAFRIFIFVDRLTA